MTAEHREPGFPAERLRAQVRLIVQALAGQGITVGACYLPDHSLDFLYEEGVILVRDPYLRQVEELVPGAVLEGFYAGVSVYRLADGGGREPGAERDREAAQAREPGDGDEAHGNGRGHGDRNGEPRGRGNGDGDGEPGGGGREPGWPGEHPDSPTLAALDRIDAALGAGVAAPSHIFSVTPVYCCPATEPLPVPEGALPDPGPCDGGGTGVLLCIPDTGLLAGASAHPWLGGVTGTPDIPPRPESGGGHRIVGYTGHGTFVAGVARCMAPLTQVQVTDDFKHAGAISERLIVRRLNLALSLSPDIISLSAGGTTRKDLPPLGFEAFWHRYRQHKNTLLIAAAGNNGSRRPFWPAAFADVVGVGALAADRRGRAYFSDYGPWVDVYAPGEGLVNAYAAGTYVCREPPHQGQHREFHGMARWSGTSFATPLVAGLIAARISRTGENSRQAAGALLAAARRQRLAGTGPVLLPCDTGSELGPCGCGGCGDGRGAG
ncbi:MAG: S8 family peptidase [Streptosporangiaceae bacterium]